MRPERPFKAAADFLYQLCRSPSRGHTRPVSVAKDLRHSGRTVMDFEKYTDRARGFVQSAQSLALREGHQQFAPEHLLKVLLDDPEGLAAGLIDRSGGRSREALSAVEAALAKRPKVEGSGAGQLYMEPALARGV